MKQNLLHLAPILSEDDLDELAWVIAWERTRIAGKEHRDLRTAIRSNVNRILFQDLNHVAECIVLFAETVHPHWIMKERELYVKITGQEPFK